MTSSLPPKPRFGSAALPVDEVDDDRGLPWGQVATALLIALVAGYAVFLLVQRHERQNTPLWVVNTTGTSGMEVAVDGKVVIRDVPSTPVESATSARTVTVATGHHVVEARDATGHSFESVAIDVAEGAYGFLFAPKRAPDVCFALDTTVPSSAADNTLEPLSTRRTVWEVLHPIDAWFTAADPFTLRKGRPARTLRAVRMMPCADIAAARERAREEAEERAAARERAREPADAGALDGGVP